MIYADAHLHLFRTGFPGVYGKSLFAPEVDVYESLRAAHMIEAGLVVGYEGEGIDPGNNAYIRSLAAERPWMTTVAYVGAHTAPSAEAVSALLKDGHAGISLYISDASGAEAASAWSAPVWRILAQHRAIVSLNITPGHMSRFLTVAKTHAECTFLISHLGQPGSFANPPGAAEAAERLTPLLRLAALPNVMVKMSAPYAISDPAHAYPHRAAEPFMDLILERFGPHRCLWGSDFSPALDHVSFVQTLSNPWHDRLDDGTRASIAGGNLLRLFASRKPA